MADEATLDTDQASRRSLALWLLVVAVFLLVVIVVGTAAAGAVLLWNKRAAAQKPRDPKLAVLAESLSADMTATALSLTSTSRGSGSSSTEIYSIDLPTSSNISEVSATILNWSIRNFATDPEWECGSGEQMWIGCVWRVEDSPSARSRDSSGGIHFKGAVVKTSPSSPAPEGNQASRRLEVILYQQ